MRRYPEDSMRVTSRTRLSARPSFPIRPCSHWGLPSQRSYPLCWWALTPPFHPYLLLGGLFSVALSLSHLRPPLTASAPCGVPTFLPLSPRLKRATTRSTSRVCHLEIVPCLGGKRTWMLGRRALRIAVFAALGRKM